MKAVFVDTFCWLAVVNRADNAHVRALTFLNSYDGKFVTTDWILIEVADALARTAEGRNRFVALRSDLMSDPDVIIVECSPNLLENGVSLYASRPDKTWSLTDCISFEAMNARGLTDALTGDRHFEQAGFVALLK